MSSQLSWHSENQVVHLQLSGNVTSDILLKNSEFISGLLDETRSDRLHVIIDLLRASQLPKDTGSLRNVLAPMLSHQRMGWAAVVTGNLMIQSILNRTIHRLTENWGYVSSIREAADLLRRADSRQMTIPFTEQKNAILYHIK